MIVLIVGIVITLFGVQLYQISQDAAKKYTSRAPSPPLPLPTAETPALKIEGDAAISLEVVRNAIQDVSLTGTSNLPKGTKLALRIVEQLENGIVEETACFVSDKGNFQSNPFSRSQVLPDGLYSAEVTLSPSGQTQHVLNAIGDRGQHLKGPLVQNGPLGATLSHKIEFKIGLKPEESQAKRQKQIDDVITSVTHKFCAQLEQLLDIKYLAKQYGESPLPYEIWSKDVKPLRADAYGIPARVLKIPELLLKLQLDMKTGQTEAVINQQLQAIKEVIKFDKYLAEKYELPIKSSDYRKWQHANGMFEIDTLLVGKKDDRVLLRRRDGTQLTMPISLFSTQDIEYIEELFKD